MKAINFFMVAVGAVMTLGGLAHASIVTGHPGADGWVSHGNSLTKGLYVRGSANYGFRAYTGAMTVTAGSMLDISDGAFSWLPGDQVLGVGGVYENITASEAGWPAITGNTVNRFWASTANGGPAYGPKLIAKFGTANATFTPSTTAPGSGNGVGSTNAGGLGTVFVRSSGWFHATTPLPNQGTSTTWSHHSGQLMLLDDDSHISRVGAATPNKRVARLIWIYDSVLQKPSSWQILLNVSLLDRLVEPGFTGLTPGLGDLAIISMQDRDSAFTDAVVSLVPSPSAAAILVLAGVIGLRRRRATTAASVGGI